MSCNNDSVYEVDLGVTVGAYKTVLISAASDEEAVETVKTLHDAGALSSLTHKAYVPQWDAIEDERVVFLRNTKTGSVLLEGYQGSGDTSAEPGAIALEPLLPQAFELGELLKAAQAVLPLLEEGALKSDLIAKIQVFSDVVVPTTWCVGNVQELRPDLSAQEAREALFMLSKRHECTESDWALIHSLADGVRKRPDELQPGVTTALRAPIEIDSVTYEPGTPLKVIEPEAGDNGAVVAYLVELMADGKPAFRVSVEAWQVEHQLDPVLPPEGHALTD